MRFPRPAGFPTILLTGFNSHGTILRHASGWRKSFKFVATRNATLIRTMPGAGGTRMALPYKMGSPMGTRWDLPEGQIITPVCQASPVTTVRVWREFRWGAFR